MRHFYTIGGTKKILISINMKKLTPYILFALILLALIWKSCEDARDKERLINQLSEYQLKEKAFDVKRKGEF